MSTLKVNNITDLGDDAVVTSGVLDTLAVPAGGILQVVSTTKTDTFASSSVPSAGYADITGLSVSITPSSTSSKILVLVNATGSSIQSSTFAPVAFSLKRDATRIAIGDVAGNITPLSSVGASTSDQLASTANITFLDSPSTTSAITYQVEFANGVSGVGRVFVLNRAANDSNLNERQRAVSSITVMEVAG